MTQGGFHEALEERFGGRYKTHLDREREVDGPMAVVSPVDGEEVEFLAELANRYSVRLLPEGAVTVPKLRRPPGAVSVRFDLMRGVSVPQPPD